MSAVASYQSPNNYNLVEQIRPFNLPYESSMKEISMKSEYFKQGLDRVKSIYDQAVGLDPQFAQNKEYLKTFMNDANKKISKLTRSDLSISDNSGQAANIFKPLYDTSNKFNRGLLTDSQLNKFYRQQEELANTYRTKDGGKQWNQDNEFYFRDAQNKYLEDAKAGNLDSLDGHFQSKKGYIPYYDYKKEMLDIQEACHGQAYQTKDVSSQSKMYFQESSKKGCTPEELALAYKTGLSGQARQQMGIEGYARFKGNEDELARQFTDIYVTKKKETIDNIHATLQGIKSGGISKEEMPRYNQLQNLFMQLGQEYKDSKAEYEDMIKADGNVINYVKRNYDRLAGQVHFGNVVQQAGQAFRTDETKNLVSTNPAGMLEYKSEVDRGNIILNGQIDSQLEKEKQAGRVELETLKSQLEGSGKDGSGAGNPQAGRPVTMDNKEPEKITESNYKETNVKPAMNKLNDAYAVMGYYVKKDTKQTNSPNHQQIVNYITEIKKKQERGEPIDQNAKDALEAYENYSNAKFDLSVANNKVEATTNQLKQSHKELFDDSNFDKKQYTNYVLEVKNKNNQFVKITNPPSLSQSDIFHVLNGENVKGFTSQTVMVKEFQGGMTGNLYTNKSVKKLYFNGNEVNTDNTKKLNDVIQSVLLTSEDNINKLNSLKTEIYTKNYYENSPFTMFNRADFGKEKDWKDYQDNKFQGALGVPGGLGEKDGYEIAYRDKTGEGAWVRLLDDKGFPKPISSSGKDPMLARLRGSGYGSGVKKDNIQGGYAYYIPNIFPRYAGLPNQAGLEKLNKVKDAVLDIQQNLSSNPNIFNQPVFDSRTLPSGGTTMFRGPKSNIDYLISMTFKKGQSPKYIATYHSNKGEERTYSEDSLDELLAIISEN